MHLRCPGCRTVFENNDRDRTLAVCPACQRSIRRGERIVVQHPNLSEPLQKLASGSKFVLAIGVSLVVGLLGRWLLTMVMGDSFAKLSAWPWFGSGGGLLRQLGAGFMLVVFLVAMAFWLLSKFTQLSQTREQIEPSGNSPNPGEAPANPAAQTWWLFHEGKPTGPFSTTALLDAAESGDFPLTAPICAVGSQSWSTLESLCAPGGGDQEPRASAPSPTASDGAG